MVADELNRAHERIDELVRVVSRTAALQERNAEDINRLTATIAAGMHPTPCSTAIDLCRRVCQLEEFANDTVEVKREAKRDWRGLWIAASSAIAGGVGTAIILQLIHI